MESVAVETDEISKLKSPLRILVRSFKRSRDKWKNKFVAVKTDIKRYKNQSGDARRSRDQWRSKAELLEAQVQQLTADRDHWKQAAEQKTHPR